MVIGLDPSTKTGWALWDGKIFTHGLTTFPKKSGISRVYAFENWLDKFLTGKSISLAVVEGYGYANTHSLVPLVEIGTALRLVLHRRGIQAIDIPPTVLKKFATGTGNSRKSAIMLEVYRRWRFEADTDDEVDAYVLCRIGRAIMGDTSGLTKAQIAALGKVSLP